MKNRLTEITGKLLPIFFLTAVLVAYFPAKAAAYDIDIVIDPAPYIINVNGNMTTFVIHTNMPYYYVDPNTVTVNGVDIFAWKMDDLGFFDAIVMFDAILQTLEVGTYNTLTLEGMTTPGEVFGGEKDLLISDRAIGAGKIIIR